MKAHRLPSHDERPSASGYRERKETIKRIDALLEDADGLIVLTESVATVLSEKRDELPIRADVEALLRASIAAATIGINIYLAVLVHTKKSPMASRYLAEVRRRCRRSVEQLRRRVRQSIAHLSRVIEEKQLGKVANCA